MRIMEMRAAELIGRSLIGAALIGAALVVANPTATTAQSATRLPAAQSSAVLPPRPAGYDGVSDHDLYLRLSDPIADARDNATRQAAYNRLTRPEVDWMKAYAKRTIDQYLADRDAGRLPSQQAAVVAAPAPVPAPPVSQLSQYQQNTVVRALNQVSGRYTHGEQIFDPCSVLHGLQYGMTPNQSAETDSLCGTSAQSQQRRAQSYAQGQAEAAREYAAEGARARASGPRPVAEPGLVTVRAYDQRTGAYTGTTVMTQTEADLRGATPQ